MGFRATHPSFIFCTGFFILALIGYITTGFTTEMFTDFAQSFHRMCYMTIVHTSSTLSTF